MGLKTEGFVVELVSGEVMPVDEIADILSNWIIGQLQASGGRSLWNAELTI